MKIAIVGAGPSGCFTAQALLKALPGAEVDILDRLPVPYGLVRYGVAPDHQGTKAVIRQFERLFERQGVAFFGNVELGRDIGLDELRGLYDAVVLATGLSADRRLGIPGEDLAGVIGAGRLTRAWNDHPDAAEAPALGRRVVILGNGNVAMDLVRILAKAPGEFEGSDLSARNAETLAAAGVETIEVVGRSPAAQAKFDPVMVRELGKLMGARIRVIGAEDAEGKLAEALDAVDGHAPEGATRTVTFHFGWTPVRLTGGARVEAAQFAATDGGGEEMTLDCDSFLTAIGFESALPAEREALLAQAGADGHLGPGLYATGWFRRGPRGTIPENRADAQAVAARIAAELSPGGKPGRAALAARLPRAVDYAGWQRIDAAEREDCPPGRCRRKITTIGRMLEIARPEGDA